MCGFFNTASNRSDYTVSNIMMITEQCFGMEADMQSQLFLQRAVMSAHTYTEEQLKRLIKTLLKQMKKLNLQNTVGEVCYICLFLQWRTSSVIYTETENK